MHGACSRRRTTVRVRGHEVVPPPSAKGRQLRRCRRGGTAAVVRGVGHVRVVEREGHARRPRSSHRRRQVPGADGARWRGAEGGRRHSGGAGGSIRMLQADSPRPGRLLAHRSDRRRVSTRGNAHAGRGRLHGVGARTQGATQTQPPLSTLWIAGRPPVPPRGQPAGRHGRPPGQPPATYGPASIRAGPARRPRGWPGRPSRADLAASRIWASAGRVAGRICPAARPDLGLGQPGGRPDFSGGPAGFGRSAGRIWGVGQPVWGGRPAGFGGSAGRVGRAASRSPLTAQPPLSGHRFLSRIDLVSDGTLPKLN